MKPSEITQAVTTLVAARRLPFIWGPPGVGKSESVHAFCKQTGRDMIDLRAVLRDPVDLRGLPKDNGDGTVKWLTPGDLPKTGRGTLFLDELPNAPESTLNGLLQLALDRKLGDYTLPDGWDIIAAGNRETDRTGARRLPSALAARFTHLDYEIDLNDWTRWAIPNQIKTEIIAFLHFRPGLLHDFDPKQRATPNPRAWKFVHDILAQSPPAAIEHGLLAGTVGEGAAAELVGFMRVFRTLAMPDAILANPGGIAVPTEPATLYATCAALAAKANPNNAQAVVTFADRLPTEFGVFLCSTALRMVPAIAQTRAMIGWQAANSAVLI